MTDVAYDIDIDVGAGVEPIAHQPQQVIEVSHGPGPEWTLAMDIDIHDLAKHNSKGWHSRSIPRRHQDRTTVA